MIQGPDFYGIDIPQDSRVVHVGRDPESGMPCLWMEVNTESPRVVKNFWVKGTGWGIQEDLVYIGSAICGEFVWHIYERNW